jgi:hypothetical protein
MEEHASLPPGAMAAWVTIPEAPRCEEPAASAAQLDAHNRAEAESLAPFRELDSEIAELSAHISAASARLLDLFARFDDVAGWGVYGAAPSFAQWASWRLGTAPAAAREQMRLAHALRALPCIRAAFAAGELSYWRVRALAKIATPETDAMLLGWAHGADAAQIGRVCGALRAALERVERERAEARHDARRVVFTFDEDGFLQLHGRLSPEDGALLMEALAAARAELAAERADDGALAPYDGQANADALVRVPERALAARREEGVSAPGPEVVLHVDAAILGDGSGDTCELEPRPALAAETARSALLRRRHNRAPGERRRTPERGPAHEGDLPSPPQGAQGARSHLPFPRLQRPRLLGSPHVQHWIRRGETRPINLVLLCHGHHRLIHEGATR